MSDTRLVYFFGDGQADGSVEIKHLIGGKGASLADMTKAKLNVPPGFTISTECCEQYYKRDKRWPDDLDPAIRTNLARLEALAGRPFGTGDNPLLVAVRSGAAQSMPGMMDTVLNAGLNPDCVRGMANRTGNHRAAWDAYRHFLVMFGHTVGGIDEEIFTKLIDAMLKETGKADEADLDAAQMETLCTRFLAAYKQHAGQEMPTEPWAMLCQAINAVFGSWNNERAITYRKHHNIDGLLGTAVTVQMMCPSEVSGVMFTANPVNPALGQIILESSYGLGEAIVLGKVTPDRFVLDKQNLTITERVIAKKDKVISTLAQDGVGQTGARDSASLTDPQIDEVAKLGLRVEEYFKHPCDIEWALSQGKFYLLQARAIKTSAKATSGDALSPEAEKVKQEEMAFLKQLADPTGTVWARFNLAEILPEPTPMTWAIVRRFMSGKGGFGLMYRDMGYDPDPALDEVGVYDLICGRPYCNLSREPKMQYRMIPLGYPFAGLKATPQKAIYPRAQVDPARASWKSVVLMPVIAWKMFRQSSLLKKLSATEPAHLREQVLPAFGQAIAEEKRADISKLSDQEILTRLETWIQKTLFDFARESLKPTVLAAVSMGNIQQALTVPLGADKVQSALGQLIMGVRPDEEADLPGGIAELSAGKLDRAHFLEKFGHRGPKEMELSKPRWSEDPSSLDKLTTQGTSALGHGASALASRETTSFKQRVAAEVRKVVNEQPALQAEVAQLHTHLALRETGKHYLMKGYALIRRLLVELDRRHNLNGGIFYLVPDELPRLAKGDNLSSLIAERKKRREVALGLEVPQVLFSDDLDAIGRPMSVAGGETMEGTPLSAGIAEGPALVLTDPSNADIPDEPYILVCPTTDPAWVPLFVKAKGLLMETGGVLSHGAIVAREFGLAAVAGLPDVHKRLKTGQRLRVDGSTGSVTIIPG